MRLFRYLPGQSGYNKRLRAAAGLIRTVIRVLAVDTSPWTDDVWVVDSTPVELRPVEGNGPPVRPGDAGLRLLRPARKGGPPRAGAYGSVP